MNYQKKFPFQIHTQKIFFFFTIETANCWLIEIKYLSPKLNYKH